jgi:hypothetical protein
LLLPLNDISDDLVDFVNSNVKKYPGNTELLFQVIDEEKQRVTKLKTHNFKLEVNDELVQFMQERETLQYSLELT